MDLEKAYDRVNWGFLDHMLQKMGFGIKWRKWVAKCYETASFSNLLNGSPGKYFHSTRGLWQSDRLSIFLFLVVVEAFSATLTKAFQWGLMEGVEVGRNGMMLTHFQFADDTLIMCKSLVRQLKFLRCVIRCFEAVLRLKINFTKSCIMEWVKWMTFGGMQRSWVVNKVPYPPCTWGCL